MILVIRISGAVGIPKNIGETLFRMRLRRKYSAVILKPTQENIKLLKKVRNFVAFGDIDKESLRLLIEKRGKFKEKVDIDKAVSEIDKKSLEEHGIKPFFRLHSPRGGIETKKHFGVGKGVLGDNKKEIKNLLERML